MRPVRARREICRRGDGLRPSGLMEQGSAVPCSVLSTLLLVLSHSVASAAPPGEATRATAGDAFGGGAVAWWLLLGLSFVALGMLFDGLLAVRRGRMMPSTTADILADNIRSRAFDAALRLGEDPTHDSLLTRVVVAGVRHAREDPDATPEEVRAAACDEGEALAARLYRRVDLLGALGALAPLVGLLGTAQALIASFGRIAASGDAARPADLAAAAGKALGTTVLGLLVAVPALAAANLLRTRLDALTHEAGRRAEQILRPLGRR